MKKKNLWKVLFLSFFLLLISGFALDQDHSVIIDKISIYPGKVNTKIFLQADSPLSVIQTYYAPEPGSTIIIDLDKTNTGKAPQIIPHGPSLVQDLRLESRGAQTARLFLRLREKVPYRIFSEQNQTVIELHNLQRKSRDYFLETETAERLAQRPESFIFLENLDISEKRDGIDVRADLNKKPVYQVFALDHPLRLVVDLFDTHFSGSSFVYPVGKQGIERVRAAQFRTSNPYAITRIVFDLTTPPFFILNSGNNGLSISFPNTHPLHTASSIPPESTPSQQSKPAPEKPAPAPSESQPKEKEPAYREPVQEKRPHQQFQPKTLDEPEEKYSGDIISLKFKDADLRDVILYLGDFAGLNVVFDPEVRGTVTCDLKDIPWDQALDIILKINKMGKVIEGNVLRIAPVALLTREDEEQRKLQESKELAGPVLVKTFTLSYSKASEIQDLLRTKISERGEIIVDQRTNTLVISDVKDRIQLLEKLISVFDTATPQVSIEARIVEATANFIRNIGVQWGFRGIVDPFYGNQTSLQFPHKILADGTLIPAGIATKGIGGPLGGYAVNLPAPAFSTAVGLSFGNVLDTFRLDMAISALETSGEGRIISCPTITTQNNQEAEILQGRQIPVQTVANFTVTTRYVNAALELRATPQITAEGTIIMNIEIRNNAADFANLVNGIPPIITQSAQATVMVNDGGTTVIGGIYRTEDSITRERVPFFHKIPILGNLFRSFARTKQNRELLIFITPRIIK
ncbi:MAG: type IV pilus secretin PilQ [Candidatus Aminicenantes bacterium]